MPATLIGGNTLQEHDLDSGVSLLFERGRRPDLDLVERLIVAPELASSGARISFRPERDEGWAELLVNGLTCDLVGLAPALSSRVPAPQGSFGLPAGYDERHLEAITLVPGPHVSARPMPLAVTRAIAGLAASLALPLTVGAVCWNPAGTWMESGYFARLVFNWLAGGAFPALGLIAIDAGEDRMVRTRGLDFFVGQELAFQRDPGESTAEAVKMVIRLADYLVRSGAIAEPRRIAGLFVEVVLAEPDPSGASVVFRREG